MAKRRYNDLEVYIMGEELIYICEICQTVLDEHHCKAVCPNCGRMFDCSDLPLMQANGRIDSHDHVIARPGASVLDILPTVENNGEKGESSPSNDTGNVANLP